MTDKKCWNIIYKLEIEICCKAILIEKHYQVLVILVMRIRKQMKSFGLWYEKNNRSKEEPIFSLHINFWSESVKKDNNVPDLDVGIKIRNFRSVKKVMFHCPFVVEKEQIHDLVPKLRKLENADIIFNIDGTLETKKSYSVYSFTKHEKEEKLVLFPFAHSFGNAYNLNVREGETEIIFDILRSQGFIGQKFKDIEEVYIRFRISSNELKNNIYFDCEPSNKSFESAFSGTRIFDFKINQKRNLGTKTLADIIEKHYLFPKIEDSHLLVMEPSSYDVEAFSNNQMTCRELEEGLWDDYFGETLNYAKGRVLAYHWKFKDECSCLIKIKYSKTNIITLTSYIVVALALGVLGSTIVAVLQMKCGDYFSYISGGIVLVLFLTGLLLGRIK